MRELVTAVGDRVSISDDLKRIISLSPAVTEILFELGLGDRIVGVSAFCGRPKDTAGIRKVGSYGSARIQVIEELNPDVIFTVSGYPEEFSKRLSDKFPVYMFGLPSSVSGIVDLVNKVGIVTERMDLASRIEKDLIRRLNENTSNWGVTGYLEIDLGGPVSFGFRSYINDALEHIGVKNIYGNWDREWLEPDFKTVAGIDPDVIFYEPKMFSKFPENGVEKLVESRDWSSLKAVKNDAVFVSPGPLDFIAHHGPTFIREVLPWMNCKVSELMKT